MIYKSKLILSIVFAASLLLAASYARAETPPAATSTVGAASVDDKGAAREKLQRRIEQMIIWELSDTMQLPSEKETKFLDMTRTYYKKKVELIRKQFASMHELRAATKEAAPDEQKLKKLLDDIRAVQEEQYLAEMDFQKNVASILDVREQARFMLEWPEIMEKVRGMLEERRKEKGGHGDDKFDSKNDSWDK